MQTNFADTILNITVTGQLVRIDLGTLTPVQNKDGQQDLQAVPCQQLVLPLEGFVRAFGLQENVMKKLIADGVLKARPQAELPPSGIIPSSTFSQ